MAWIYELKFQPSGKIEKVLTPSAHYYVLSDGRRVEMMQHFVWCFGCNDFSWAESELWSMDLAEGAIRKWEDPTSEARKAVLKECKFRDQ